MREKIIDATVEEFKQNGLKFTMNDLAKRLGISKKTIYTVFESKQAVLVAVADRYAADLYSMQEELEADVSLNVVQKLEKLLCALPEKYSNIGLSRIYELAEKYPKPYRHLMRSVNNGWETGRTVPEERHGRRSDTGSFHSGSHGNGKRYCNPFYGVRCSVPE